MSARRTRLKLLLSSYLDACEASEDGAHIGEAPGSKLLSRNAELWGAGSYKPLERCLDRLRRRHRAVYRATWRRYVLRKAWEEDEKPAEIGLHLLAEWMPSSIFVPLAIAENAGYGATEAKTYERRRRG